MKGPRLSHWRVGASELVLIVLALGLLLYRFAESFSQPFRTDEFLHVHHAWLVSQGKLPYRDFFDHHACWYHVTMAPAFLWYEPELSVQAAAGSLFFARFVSFVATSLGLLLLYDLVRTKMGVGQAIFAIALCLGSPFFFETSVETRPDVPAFALWVAGLSLFLRIVAQGGQSPPLPSRIFWVGALFGASVMFTQKTVVLLPGLYASLLYAGGFGPNCLRKSLRLLLSLSAGILIPILVTALIFTSLGAGYEFINKVFLINQRWAYHASPKPFIQLFCNENWFLLTLATGGLLLKLGCAYRARSFDVMNFTILALLISSLTSLFLVLPVVDVQFFLIPIPLLAVLAASTFASSFIMTRQVAPLIAMGLAILAFLPIPESHDRIYSSRPGRYTFDAVMWVLLETDSTQSVLDGWTGLGVFRPQAWYYGFVHLEIPPMIPSEDVTALVEALKSGHLRPHLIANDQLLLSLSGELDAWVKRHYTYEDRYGAFVRKAVNPEGPD